MDEIACERLAPSIIWMDLDGQRGPFDSGTRLPGVQLSGFLYELAERSQLDIQDCLNKVVSTYCRTVAACR